MDNINTITTKNEDGETIFWVECLSEKGNKFHLGSTTDPNSSESKKYLANKMLASKEAFKVDVTWTESSWTDTKASVKAISAISRYKIKDNGFFSYYKWQLNFVCSEHYNYRFFDKSGDYYDCDVWHNGSHYINYDSNHHAIQTVTGH